MAELQYKWIAISVDKIEIAKKTCQQELAGLLCTDMACYKETSLILDKEGNLGS